jgi:hypothetical protein
MFRTLGAVTLLTLATAMPVREAAAQDPFSGAILGGAAGAIIGGAAGGGRGAAIGAIGDTDVTWSGRTALGFKFHQAIAVRKGMTSPHRRSQVTLLHTACGAFDRMIPRVGPMSGTMA